MAIDDELPELRAILLPPHRTTKAEPRPLRRSPRKNTVGNVEQHEHHDSTHVTLSATSDQRRLSPTRRSPSKRSPLKEVLQTSVHSSILDDIPNLPRKSVQNYATASASNKQSTRKVDKLDRSDEADALYLSLSRLAVKDDTTDAEVEPVEQPKGGRRLTSRKNAKAQAVTKAVPTEIITRRANTVKSASRFVLDEATCDEDLVDSDAQDEGEDEDTDLSGFIVDDDAEISYHGSSEEEDSEEERRSKRRAQKQQPRRRLQRGRRKMDDTDDEVNTDELSNAFDHMKLNVKHDTRQQNEEIQVIDLISPEHKPSNDVSSDSRFSGINLFDRFQALKLSPTKNSQSSGIPSKSRATVWPTSDGHDAVHEVERDDRFQTPPTTPPQSPSKLKSPSKLLSPSKRGDTAQRSPHRESTDAFWDLNKVNEWNDQYSPKKAPVQSPRKNRLLAFGIWSDGEEDSLGGIDESSDSLPSPCESPSKSKSRSASPIKAEKQRFLSEKKAKQAEKKLFEENRDQMARNLLHALDKNVTDSRISKLSASTGGVQIIWSKTLRSTAGRANWRRTVTKATGSPVKGRDEETAQGAIIQHFANIELAIKVIDRQDRLINTLSHEFCHLANFMISGIRDQPHGSSFQNWARKVTKWMKDQDEVAEWKTVEVTTKHGYVIEWKYLWVCVGRDQTKAMELLNIDDEDGCGAEYGRHSKSIDTDKHRCGRCKGKLVQVRPKPRASPMKKAAPEKKEPARAKSARKGVSILEKMVEVIELSD